MQQSHFSRTRTFFNTHGIRVTDQWPLHIERPCHYDARPTLRRNEAARRTPLTRNTRGLRPRQCRHGTLEQSTSQPCAFVGPSTPAHVLEPRPARAVSPITEPRG